jgi:hypothetical protein
VALGRALVAAIVVALFAPRGLWGLISDRLGIRLFPVGYWLWPAAAQGGDPPGRRALASLRRLARR